MAERLAERRDDFGISRSVLGTIGTVLAGLGLLSRGILQRRVLGVGLNGSAELLKALDMSGGMEAATAALILECLESCAVPIFAVLLTEGFLNTKSFKNYFLRVLGTAAICELPYNYAISAKLIDTGSRNPVFGVALALMMLYLYRYCEGMSVKNIALKIVVTAAALLWAVLLGVKFGVMLLIIVCTLRLFRARRTLRYLAAAAAAICCCVGNPLYMFAPFGFLAVHFYNGDSGRENKLLHYAAYPVMLVLTCLIGAVLS